MSTLLSSQELCELIGRTQPAAQIRWLQDHGWTFTTGRDGLPKVARAHFEQKLVLGEEISETTLVTGEAKEWKVNVDALRSLSIH